MNIAFDVILEASDGRTAKLMLARGTTPDGQPLPKAWAIQEVPTPVNIRVSDSGASLVDIPPELGSVFFRGTHESGMGTVRPLDGNKDFFTGTVSTAGGIPIKPPSTTEISLPSSEGDVRKIVEAELNGPNVVINGHFGTDTDWTKGTGWSIASHVATKSAGTGSDLETTADLDITAGETYVVKYTLTRSAGTITPKLGGTNLTMRDAAGTYTQTVFVGSSDLLLKFTGDDAFAGTLNDVSVRKEKVDHIFVIDGRFLHHSEDGATFAQAYDAHERSNNGDFLTDTGWTKGTNWSIEDLAATKVAPTAADLEQDLVFVEGRSYTLTFTVTRSAGTLTTELAGTTGTVYSAGESASEVIVAGSGAALKFKANSAFAGTVTDVSVLEVDGTHVFGDIVFFGADDGDKGLVATIEDGPSGIAVEYLFTEGAGEIFHHVTADATRRFNFFFVKDETLYGLENPNTFRTTTDPFKVDATWGGATQVGDEAANFQGGFVVASVLVIFKEDRVFTVDSSGNVGTLIAQFADNPLLRNFHAFVAAHNSNIYTTVGNELWEYDPVSGGLRPIGLAQLPDTLIASATHQQGVTYDGTALYAIHQARLPSAGLSIVRVAQDAEGLPTFERLLEATDTNSYRPQGPLHATELFPSLSTGRHLFFNTTTAGKIGRMDLFRSGDPTADSASTYATRNTSLFSGHIDHRFPGQNKNYTELVLDLKGMSSTTPLSRMDVYYYLNGSEASGDRTLLIANIDANGQHVIPFPPITARQMMLEFVFKNATTAVTPALISWGLWASVDFRLREVIDLTVRLVDNDNGRSGGSTNKTAEETRQVLRDMRKAEGISIKYTDYRGYTFDNVRLLPGWQEQDMVDDETGLDMTALTIKLMRV